MKPTDLCSRRSLLKGSVLGLAALAAPALTRSAHAGELPHLAESDPTAKALKYVENAAKSAERKNADAFCRKCRFFKDTTGTATWAACDLFPGKAVNAGGWCNVWAQKS